jgi:hypothetical protein
MIKKLFFMAALLAPGLACDANPSADLSVQIVPAGSPPGVPAPALAAGFTTQALNADFTSAAYSNTATYIDNCGATAAKQWYLVSFSAQPSGIPCSETVITTDGGMNALLITTPGNQSQEFQYPGYFLKSDGLGFPNEAYIEINFRTTAATMAQDGSAPYWSSIIDLWFLGRGVTSSGTYPPNTWNEIDFLEVIGPAGQANNWGAGMIEWGGGSACGGDCYTGLTRGTTDLTQYHTLGMLLTSDESSAVWRCLFMDGVFLSPCITGLKQRFGESRVDLIAYGRTQWS